MNGMKRVLPLLLAALLLAAPPLTTTASASFADVMPWHWSAPAVDYVQEKGIMNGVGDNAFNAYGTVSRGMLATILHREAGAPHSTAGLFFEDMEAGTYYIDAVIWCAEMGVVTGVDATHFRPDDPVTREQFALMLWRLAGWPAPQGSGAVFTDAASISWWAKDGVDWAVGAGILSGFPDGSFAPQGTANRSQAAQMLMNYDLWRAKQP